jgi:hypothetical protein
MFFFCSYEVKRPQTPISAALAYEQAGADCYEIRDANGFRLSSARELGTIGAIAFAHHVPPCQ